MWRCLNCETINDGPKCIVCGEEKPPYTPPPEPVVKPPVTVTPEPAVNPLVAVKPAATDVVPIFKDAEHEDENTSYAPKRPSKSNKVIITLLVCIACIIGASILFVQITYSLAIKNMENQNYSDARSGFSSVKFYRNAKELLTECDYMEASDLLQSGKPEEAKTIFEEISGYKDSASMIKDCNYAIAKQYVDSGNFAEAYEMYKSLGDYKDCVSQLESLKQLAYDKGVELYHNAVNANNSYGIFEEAEKNFELSDNIGNEEKYKLLIRAHNHYIDDISTLYPLIGFEDTNKLLLGNYIEKFMMGNWGNSSGDYVKYYKNDDGSSSTEYNLPYTSGTYYKLENGIHYHGDDNGGWNPQWEYQIESENKIKVYCYKDGRTRTLYRR